jgi:hypothetical protein
MTRTEKLAALGRNRIYVGLRMFTRQIFYSRTEPTTATHGMVYSAVMGPFRTRRGAEFYRDHGINNPHVLCVSDAERIAARLAR